jgi:hypothetical protein
MGEQQFSIFNQTAPRGTHSARLDQHRKSHFFLPTRLEKARAQKKMRCLCFATLLLFI